jgi:hypothetical protein
MKCGSLIELATLQKIALRNADDLYVPAHHFATNKRFPLFTMPKVWNEANDLKMNPSVRIFLKSAKSALLNAIIVYMCIVMQESRI